MDRHHAAGPIALSGDCHQMVVLQKRVGRHLQNLSRLLHAAAQHGAEHWTTDERDRLEYRPSLALAEECCMTPEEYEIRTATALFADKKGERDRERERGRCHTGPSSQTAVARPGGRRSPGARCVHRGITAATVRTRPVGVPAVRVPPICTPAKQSPLSVGYVRPHGTHCRIQWRRDRTHGFGQSGIDYGTRILQCAGGGPA